MSGVEILYSWHVGPQIGIIIIEAIVILLGVLGLIGTVYLIISDGIEGWHFLLVMFCLILCISGTGLTIDESKRDENHYKVKIEDSVKFNDFMDKYEIVGKEGIIWEVKDRNEKNSSN